jgi:glycine dehydrogenase subunit 1
MNNSYIPNTKADQARMLEAIGMKSITDLFAPIPEEIRKRANFSDLPEARDDIALKRHLVALSGKNVNMDTHPCFLGAGIYDHYIPPIVGHITGRSEFYTAYTPYQPEVSQGVLQSIYEFQSLLCQLTEMEVANASLYDGATALAEAVIMAADLTKRKQILLPETLHPSCKMVVETYCSTLDLSVTYVGLDAQTGQLSLPTGILSTETACLVVQSPNFLGIIEDLKHWADAAHSVGALLVASVDPISLGILETPGACGVDILVAEGQGLGCYPAYGGPLLGIFCCRQEFIRRIPGRIVGMTIDRAGKRAYTMTLRTREQDIRRDTATSNICTNQALFALAATVYLAANGKTGLAQVANLCVQKAHHAKDEIVKIPGYTLAYNGPFFKEFVIDCPEDPIVINKKLLENGIIGGYPIPNTNKMMFCVTEQRNKADIEQLVSVLATV